MTEHQTIAFQGTIRALRRGGWAARGLLVASRHGQLIETQIGPKAFENEMLCDAWLRASAAELKVESVRIVVGQSGSDRQFVGSSRNGRYPYDASDDVRHARRRPDLLGGNA